jgi:hypothetical protein
MKENIIKIGVASLIVITLFIFFKNLVKVNAAKTDNDTIPREQIVKDSIQKIKLDSIDKINAAFQKINTEKELETWHKTKAGKIHKKHPEWSREDCEKLADGKIWIGMDYKMLIYLRGRPNSANPSNYGNGVKWQWCWYDYTPRCFYGGEDGVITSYN